MKCGKKHQFKSFSSELSLLTLRPRVQWVNLGRFWGKQKNKRSADEYLSFQIQEIESTTLETTLGAFCE